jgi:hypothetical protein
MSTTHVIQIVIEVLIVIALLLGIVYQPAIARWERKQAEKMLKAFKKRKEYRK